MLPGTIKIVIILHFTYVYFLLSFLWVQLSFKISCKDIANILLHSLGTRVLFQSIFFQFHTFFGEI